MARILSNQDLPTDRARELIELAKQAKNLLASIKTIRSLLVLKAACRHMVVPVTSSGHEKNVQVPIHLLSLLKQTRQKSTSLAPLIGHLAVVVDKWRPKNGNLIN